jgi:hypothetical protein
MNGLTDHRFNLLKKAAAAGHDHAGVASDWRAAIDRLVVKARAANETHEQAFSRVTSTGEGAAFLKMQRAAEDRETADRIGRPREYQPAEVRRGQIEKALSDAALNLAKARGLSFERAFGEVLDTPAGRQLYTALRAEV